MKRIYADHSATTKMSQEVFDEILPYLTEKYGNAVIESKIDHLAQSERISRHQHDTCNMMLGLP